MKRTILSSAAAVAILVAPAAAEAAKYAGKTDQGTKITFSLKGKKISKLDSIVAVACMSPQSSTPKGGADWYKHPGSFNLGKTAKASERQPSAVAYGNPTKNYTTKTRLQGKKITGKLNYNFSYYEPDLYYPKTWFCVGVADFTAKKA